MSAIWSKEYIGVHVKYPLFLYDFNETWSFWTYFVKNPQISNLINIRLVGAQLLRADGRTDGQTWRN